MVVVVVVVVDLQLWMRMNKGVEGIKISQMCSLWLESRVGKVGEM